MNFETVPRNWGDTFQTTAASNAAAHKAAIAVRNLRCSSANTASMIGIVTSAVREITTNIMLTRKLRATTASSARQPYPVGSQESHNRIGQCYRAEHEFLALVDIVFYNNPV